MDRSISLVGCALIPLLLACGTDVESTLPAPAPLSCDVVGEHLLTTGGHDARISTDGEGRVHVVWIESGVRALVRDVLGGPWERADDVLAGTPAKDVALAGYTSGAGLLTLGGGIDTTSLWRFANGQWSRTWETDLSGKQNQGRRPLAAAPDGALFFSLGVLPDDGWSEVRLLGMSLDASVPSYLEVIEEGGNPITAVDAAGARHVLFNDPQQDRLHYLGPGGRQSLLPNNYQGWPDIGVSDAGVFALSRDDVGPGNAQILRLSGSTDGGEWRSHIVHTGTAQPCEDLGTWNHEAIGTVCDHLLIRASGSLVSGADGMMLVREYREEGQKEWKCSDQGEQMCYWSNREGFVTESRLLVGTLSTAGTVLAPLGIVRTRSFAFEGALDDAGRLHVLVSGKQEPNGSTSHEYFEVACEATP